MIGVIDLGISNVGSVLNMLKHLGLPAREVRSGSEAAAAEKLILPGVGHFGHAMDKLRAKGLVEPIREAAQTDNKAVLGICLGMQLLLDHSEEGDAAGLGLVPGRCIKFSSDTQSAHLPTPHMGWRSVTTKRTSSLIEGLPPEPRFYFVHSYHAVIKSDAVVLEASYGCVFTAAFQLGNIYGVQFHPEKSHSFGQQILKNFATS